MGECGPLRTSDQVLAPGPALGGSLSPWLWRRFGWRRGYSASSNERGFNRVGELCCATVARGVGDVGGSVAVRRVREGLQILVVGGLVLAQGLDAVGCCRLVQPHAGQLELGGVDLVD